MILLITHKQDLEKVFQPQLYNFLQIFILLYADVTVIVAETANDLNEALYTYERYCDIWKLTVNISETKIVVFSKGRQRNYHFTYKNEPIEIVNKYKYIGIFLIEVVLSLKLRHILQNKLQDRCTA
jgi:hypothetical protein